MSFAVDVEEFADRCSITLTMLLTSGATLFKTWLSSMLCVCSCVQIHRLGQTAEYQLSHTVRTTLCTLHCAGPSDALESALLSFQSQYYTCPTLPFAARCKSHIQLYNGSRQVLLALYNGLVQPYAL